MLLELYTFDGPWQDRIDLPQRLVDTSADRDLDSVLLTIRDQGCGISEEDLQHITEPMFTTKKESGGIGLGLYITDSIVKDHGGTIRFTSAPGRGTQVVVTFPMEASK